MLGERSSPTDRTGVLEVCRWLLRSADSVSTDSARIDLILL